MSRCSCLRILLIFAALGRGPLFAQSCPPSDGKNIDAPQPSVLHGTVKYHPGTRPWIGLVLPKPACGAVEIELAFSTSERWHHIKQMDHCSATVNGVITESPTVYYSADLNIFDGIITPDAGCKLGPPDPDYSKISIPDAIKSYQATIFTDIRANKPMRGEVSALGRRLEPWQPYVQYFLNGEEDLSLSCRDGLTLVSYRIAAGHGQLLEQTAWLYAENGAPASLTILCRRNN